MVSLDLQDAYFQVPVHVISPVPEVLCVGECLPVLCSLFWPFHHSAGVYSCHDPCLVDNASLRFSHSEVSRRLASPRLLLSRNSTGEGLSPLALSGARHPCQLSQELPDSFSDPGLSGDEASDASFEGFHDPKRVLELSSLVTNFASYPLQPLSL